MLRSLINLNHPAHYFGVGPFSISVGNAVMIAALAILFTLALLLPFPHGGDSVKRNSGKSRNSEKKESEK
jgi:hypothetical protein